MSGDYVWKNGHSINKFKNGGHRQVVMSAAVQPDFENTQVMIKVLELGDQACHGEDLADFSILSSENKNPYGAPPSSVEKKNRKKALLVYEEQLHKHMIYHLTAAHMLPAKNNVIPITEEQAKALIEGL